VLAASAAASTTRIGCYYYDSDTTSNPTGIVAVGPQAILDEPHGREAR
jgi:glutathionyl-hydroquinone reductase